MKCTFAIESSTRQSASRYTCFSLRPAAGHERYERERHTALFSSRNGRHSSRWNNILSGDFLRETSTALSLLPFWHERRKREAKWMDRNGRRSLARHCRIAGARHPVDPSTRFLPKVFFPVWKGWIRTLSRNRKKTKKTCCCQDFHIRKENETAPHQYGLPFAFAFLTKRLP